jgi:hypothetical protein
MARGRLAYLLLRIGAAFAFLYPAIRAIYDPTSWIGYFPRFILDAPSWIGFSVDPLVLLNGFGAIEVVLALWILSGRNIRIPATLATLTLVAIVAVNWTLMDLVFRDLSIAAMTLALAFWPRGGAAASSA